MQQQDVARAQAGAFKRLARSALDEEEQPAHIGGRRNVIVMVHDRREVHEPAREARAIHPGSSTDDVDDSHAEVADEEVRGRVVAELNHRNDELPHREPLAVSRGNHEIGAVDEIAAVEGDLLCKRSGRGFLHRVGGRHDEHFDDRSGRKATPGLVRDERRPGSHRSRVDADSSGHVARDCVNDAAHRPRRKRGQRDERGAGRAQKCDAFHEPVP